MSKVDAESALAIYRHFCKQTEMVVEYLAVANKLQNLLNVSIPNLKHVRFTLSLYTRWGPDIDLPTGACLSCRCTGRVYQRSKL